MSRHTRFLLAAFVVWAAWPPAALGQAPVGTAFTYQGQLRSGGLPVTGLADFQFTLWDAATTPPGVQVGTTQSANDVSVGNGLFTVTLDFGTDAFTGDARWLDIAVRVPAGGGTYTTLTPRQELTPTPYATRAAQNWALTGNAGTDPATDFVGTTDNQPLVLRAGGQVVAQFGGGSGRSPAPNVVHGWVGNGPLGNFSTAIGGGGDPGVPNRANDEYNSIGGGKGNETGASWDANDLQPCATIGGGCTNQAIASYGTIAGGGGNAVFLGAWYSTIGGGESNLTDVDHTFIGGGGSNVTGAPYSTIGGGLNNSTGNTAATIGGGEENQAGGDHATIGGGGGVGTGNVASGERSTIGGGQSNIASGTLSTVSGGEGNEATGTGAMVGGGRVNHALGGDCTVAGGVANTAGTSSIATVGGGRNNTADGYCSAIAGGQSNYITFSNGAIGGGYGNQTHAHFATVAGGRENRVEEEAASIGGGWGNNCWVGALRGTIGGGEGNNVYGEHGTIGGGYHNLAEHPCTTVAGGCENAANFDGATVGGGEGNNAIGIYSTVPGGNENFASGDYSFAAGRQAEALHTGSFVWADSTGVPFASTANDQFLIRASGGVGICASPSTERLRVVATGNLNGSYFESDQGSAIFGHCGATSGQHCGVIGNTNSPNGFGIWGGSSSVSVFAQHGSASWYWPNCALSATAVGTYAAVAAMAADGPGVFSTTTNGQGVHGISTAANMCGVLGENGNASGWGVYAAGRMGASGTKSFQIDHPLDPANKYLQHYTTEGPEPMNGYSGTVVLDDAGSAWVSLPDYFESINRDFRYQLTAIGAAMPNLHVAAEIERNKFLIAGGEPSKKVSWEVKGVRNDPYVRAYGAPVEVEKTDDHRGKYLHPELYGQPVESSLRVPVQPARAAPLIWHVAASDADVASTSTESESAR